jgi:aminoglycoside 3-N-acetyltransferase
VLGLNADDVVLVHASFKSLGICDPEEILGALLAAIGPGGTLLMPALTYAQEPVDIHDTRTAPTCVGYLSEYFRRRPGTLRSLHPTHSVCAVGARAREIVAEHWRDTTPCGANSPFRRNIELRGKILMIGCGLRPNTTMHAVEELIAPPYLYGPEREYTITDHDGRVFQRTYTTHGFSTHGYWQRYDRVDGLLPATHHRQGPVGEAQCHLIDAAALRTTAVERMRIDPFCFVERRPPESK